MDRLELSFKLPESEAAEESSWDWIFYFVLLVAVLGESLLLAAVALKLNTLLALLA